MMNFIQNRWIELAMRYIVGITFIYASLHKITAPAEFAKIIYGYGLFPHITINLIAIVLPFLELVTGLSLILGVYTRGAAALVGTMLSMFIIAISINLIRGYEFDCGCFSFGKEKGLYSTQQLLVRDVVYFLMCTYLLRFRGERWCTILRERRV